MTVIDPVGRFSGDVAFSDFVEQIHKSARETGADTDWDPDEEFLQLVREGEIGQAIRLIDDAADSRWDALRWCVWGFFFGFMANSPRRSQ